MNVPFRFQGQVHDSHYPRNGQQGLSGTAHSGIGTGEDLSFGGGETTGCGILRGKGDCASVIIGGTYGLAGKRGLQAPGTPFRNGRGCDTQRLAAFPTCMAVEYGRKVLLFDKTDGGDRILDEFLSGLAERFLMASGNPGI